MYSIWGWQVLKRLRNTGRQSSQKSLWNEAKKSTKRGGKREGAGRKRVAPRAQVSHRARESVCALNPLHVTLRVCDAVPSLRRHAVYAVLREVFCAMKQRDGFRLVEYSIQSNHVHLIVEADSKDALSRAMNSLMTRIARRLNKFFGRAGRFFADRYHAVMMRSVKQVRRTLLYVLANAKHHGVRLHHAIDDFSSGAWYKNWLENVEVATCIQRLECPTQSGESMLLHQGAMQLGPISIYERPR